MPGLLGAAHRLGNPASDLETALARLCLRAALRGRRAWERILDRQPAEGAHQPAPSLSSSGGRAPGGPRPVQATSPLDFKTAFRGNITAARGGKKRTFVPVGTHAELRHNGDRPLGVPRQPSVAAAAAADGLVPRVHGFALAE